MRATKSKLVLSIVVSLIILVSCTFNQGSMPESSQKLFMDTHKLDEERMMLNTLELLGTRVITNHFIGGEHLKLLIICPTAQSVRISWLDEKYDYLYVWKGDAKHLFTIDQSFISRPCTRRLKASIKTETNYFEAEIILQIKNSEQAINSLTAIYLPPEFLDQLSSNQSVFYVYQIPSPHQSNQSPIPLTVNNSQITGMIGYVRLRKVNPARYFRETQVDRSVLRSVSQSVDQRTIPVINREEVGMRLWQTEISPHYQFSLVEPSVSIFNAFPGFGIGSFAMGDSYSGGMLLLADVTFLFTVFSFYSELIDFGISRYSSEMDWIFVLTYMGLRIQGFLVGIIYANDYNSKVEDWNLRKQLDYAEYLLLYPSSSRDYVQNSISYRSVIKSPSFNLSLPLNVYSW